MLNRSYRLLSRWLVLCLVVLLALPMLVSAQTDIDFTSLDTEPIEIGETVENEINAEQPIVAYTFEATEGQVLTAYAEIDTEDVQLLYVIFTNEDGEVLAENYGDDFFEYSSRVLPFIVPEDGEYTLSVTGSDYYITQEEGEEAAFSLTLEEFPAEAIEYGEEIEGTLTLETPAAVFVFEGERGQIPQLVVENEVDSLSVEVGSAAGSEFSERSGNTPVGTSDLYVTPFYLLDDGTFYVLVSTFTSFPEDFEEAFTLRLQEYEALTIEAGETLTVPLGIETLSNFVTFEGENGQVITLTGDAPEDYQIAIFDPDGRVIAVEAVADGVQELELLEDGVYTIQVFIGGFGLIELSDLGEATLTLEVEE
ncbi:MAG: hypothetical protein SF029_19725 [bacterium]|nr:hypothetical protein [bacterium]